MTTLHAKSCNKGVISIRFIQNIIRCNAIVHINLFHNLIKSLISFLHNNPGMDTVSDIAEMRMLQKGNVSSGVESLIKKGFLCRTPDVQDRRKIHLSLTDSALPLVEEVELQKQKLLTQIFTGFSEEERRLYGDLNERIRNNVIMALGKES